MFGQTGDHFRRRLGRLSSRIDPVSRGWVLVMGGNVGRLALGFAASILIARALGPAAFGVYAVLGAAIAIVGVVADLGLTVTTVSRLSTVWPDEPLVAHIRGRVASWLRVAAALFFFMLAAVLAVPVANQVLGLSHVPNGPQLFLLAMAGMVAIALSGTVSTILQATNNFGRLSTMSLVNAGLTTILALILALVGRLNLVTALVILGIGTALASFLTGYRLLPGRWALWRPPAIDQLRLEGSALFRLSRWMWLAGLFTVLIMQLDVVLVGRLTTAVAAGMYGLALNVARKADVVNHSLYTALLPTASGLDSQAAVRKYLRHSMMRSGLIALALLVMIPLADPFIRIFYGPEYAPAAGLLRLLLIVVIVDAFALPFILLVFPLERPKLYAASTAVQVVFLVALAVWLIPIIGTPGAAVAKIAARILGLALVIWRLRIWRLATSDGVT